MKTYTFAQRVATKFSLYSCSNKRARFIQGCDLCNTASIPSISHCSNNPSMFLMHFSHCDLIGQEIKCLTSLLHSELYMLTFFFVWVFFFLPSFVITSIWRLIFVLRLNFAEEYVTCHTCRSPETILQKDTRLYFLQCETCHSRCSVASIKTGFQAVTGKRAQLRAKAN